MDPKAEVERVSLELSEWLHRSGTPLYELSRDLGRHPSYLSRAFGGRLRLKVEDAFALLRELHASPRQFFAWLYPFGGPAAAAVERDPRYQEQADRSMEALLLKREEMLGHTRRTPADWTGRVRALLRDLLRRKKIAQQRASREMGLAPKALARVLHGEAKLTFEHLFGVLAVADTLPGRFFFELFGAPEGDAFAALQWVRYLDSLEKATPHALALIAAERGRVEPVVQPSPVVPEPAAAEEKAKGSGERRGPGRPPRRAPPGGR